MNIAYIGSLVAKFTALQRTEFSSTASRMPEERKPELESKQIFEKDIYFDSEVVEKLWIKDPKSCVDKPAKETLETFIFKGCDDERVILLMGSDCSTEDLMMEDEVLSDWSSELLFGGDNMTNSVFLGDKVDADSSVCELSGSDDHTEGNKLSQDEGNEAEVTDSVPSSVIVDRNEHQDQVNEDMFSCINEVDSEFQDCINITQQYPGTIPYSGSISLRSTSSTASTQSFAFPILAHEWNVSPVRMPKPQKWQLRKPRHWKMKMCWVCCKF